jgi:hypothetical protein
MGSNLAKDEGFLRAVKIHSMTSFEGEVKASVQCCKLLRHVKEPYENEKCRQNSPAISCQVSPVVFATRGVSAHNCQRAPVDESGMIRTRMGTHAH